MSSKAAAAVNRITDDPTDLAAYDIVVAAGAAAIPAIVELLEADRDTITMTALLEMLKLPDPVAALEPLLASPDDPVAEAAMAALARLDDARVSKLILANVDRMRRDAVDALGDHGDPAGLATLRALVARSSA